MQLSSFQTLQLLVNSLTPIEQESVEQRSRIKQRVKGQQALIRLYSIMVANPVADEEMIFNRWRRAQVKSVSFHVFENTRSQLKLFILDTIRCIQNPEREGNLQRRLDFAEILMSKGLMGEAYKTLAQIDTKQLGASDGLYSLLIQYKMLQLIPYAGPKDTVEEVNELISNSSKVLEQVNTFHQINIFHLEVGSIARTTSIVKTFKHHEQVAKLLTHPATYIPVNMLPIAARTLLFKTLSWLYRILANYYKAYHYQLQLIATMQSEETVYIKLEPQKYAAEIADLINISIKAGQVEEAQHYLEKYISICRRLKLNTLHNQLVTNHYSIQVKAANKSIRSDDEHLHKQLLLLRSKGVKLQPGHFAVFMFEVMKAMFVTEQYKTVQSCYAAILNREMNEREDVHFTAEIIYTLSLYHLQPVEKRYQMIETTDLFEQQAQSLHRRLRPKQEDLPFEICLSNCFRNLAGKRRFKDHIATLNKLVEQVEQLESRGYLYQKQFMTLFNITEWATGQIEFLSSFTAKNGDLQTDRHERQQPGIIKGI